MNEERINFTYINGDQNNYPTATQITINHNHFAEGNEREKYVVDPDDPMSSYIPNHKLCSVVKDLAAQCEKKQDILVKLVPFLTGVCELSSQTICSKNFLEALSVSLKSIPNANYDNLKKTLNMSNF